MHVRTVMYLYSLFFMVMLLFAPIKYLNLSGGRGEAGGNDREDRLAGHGWRPQHLSQASVVHYDFVWKD